MGTCGHEGRYIKNTQRERERERRAGSGVEGKTLEFTPSWVVASVCFGIVLISLAVEKILLCVGQLLQKSRWKMLVGAFRKIKEELMLLGFISLLLAVFQTRIEKICIPERLANVWLPCKKPGPSSTTGEHEDAASSMKLLLQPISAVKRERYHC
ncbi:hypothetical protein EUGRSUZ_A00400 [Eucalyptus grandis]|uniref:Uncharacterized protein n=2 Tax=Eucalyptus grandis TaxID=71139 RepID=A0ACC3M121_EUCGR|nr:hypothetical protein EUGRSUZ_A00400 [Eucalyptus grandis]